jgi:hypothetical protein
MSAKLDPACFHFRRTERKSRGSSHFGGFPLVREAHSQAAKSCTGSLVYFKVSVIEGILQPPVLSVPIRGMPRTSGVWGSSEAREPTSTKTSLYTIPGGNGNEIH